MGSEMKATQVELCLHYSLCVTLGKLLNFSKPQFPHLSNWGKTNNDFYFNKTTARSKCDNVRDVLSTSLEYIKSSIKPRD